LLDAITSALGIALFTVLLVVGCILLACLGAAGLIISAQLAEEPASRTAANTNQFAGELNGNKAAA
jgi:hypothetical protein